MARAYWVHILGALAIGALVNVAACGGSSSDGKGGTAGATTGGSSGSAGQAGSGGSNPSGGTAGAGGTETPDSGDGEDDGSAGGGGDDGEGGGGGGGQGGQSGGGGFAGAMGGMAGMGGGGDNNQELPDGGFNCRPPPADGTACSNPTGREVCKVCRATSAGWRVCTCEQGTSGGGVKCVDNLPPAPADLNCSPDGGTP